MMAVVSCVFMPTGIYIGWLEREVLCLIDEKFDSFGFIKICGLMWLSGFMRAAGVLMVVAGVVMFVAHFYTGAS